MTQIALTGRWLKLLGDCLVKLHKYGVNVILNTDLPYLKQERVYSKGYWDDEDPKNPYLVCHITDKLEEWVPIFAHEYCHFCQWIEKSDLWYRSQQVTADEMKKILSGKKIAEDRLHFCLNAMRDLELDCEKRTVRLFKRYKVPISTTTYIQQANAYIHFYNHIKEYRQWYPKTQSPYEKEKIIKLCSTKFYKSYDKIPNRLNKVFNEVYKPRRIKCKTEKVTNPE